jgi:hypothetical protein
MTFLRARLQSSLLYRIGLGLAIGIGLFALSAFLEIVLNDGKIGGVNLYLDNVLTGLIAGGIVFWYEQRRHRVLLDRIRVIADMNHHVRNALQVITWASHTDQSNQIHVIEEAAKRIQWALREILPGEDGIAEIETANTSQKPPASRQPRVG